MNKKNIILAALLLGLISITSFVLYLIYRSGAQTPLVRSLNEEDVGRDPWGTLEKYTNSTNHKSSGANQDCERVPSLKGPVKKLIMGFYQQHYYGSDKPILMSEFMVFLEQLNDEGLNREIRARNEMNVDPSREYAHSGQFWNAGRKIDRRIYHNGDNIRIQVKGQLVGKYRLSHDKHGQLRAALLFKPGGIVLCKQVVWWDVCATLKGIYLSQNGLLVVFDRKQANYCVKF